MEAFLNFPSFSSKESLSRFFGRSAGLWEARGGLEIGKEKYPKLNIEHRNKKNGRREHFPRLVSVADLTTSND